ncbi:hypothetical protein HF1_07710 [Mycoplasma haemofelis str. Langford 1]|uniref:Uncharacterized protein n=1 Tax=Mycoplasma haemofelis (strain Langford 1) TaxID=941640 RepID=E8ZI08_MYCHL|nr:hypothetical protein [Mycoplasma haemofelis]CBY92779.1 hypothetical protein HF1_07710 [Mycoplasma haemofelis str. Langford 1]
MASLPTKALLGSASAVGVGGATFAGVKALNNYEYIESKIKSSLLIKKESDDKWNARLTWLKDSNKAKEDQITDDLKELRKKSNVSVDDLKRWCSDSLRSKFVDKTDTRFKNVKVLCTLNIGDQISTGKLTSESQKSDSKITSLFGKLSNKQQSELSPEMWAVKNTADASTDHKGNEALKTLCLSSYEIPFEEENDPKFLEVKEYCVTT